ncbi:MAG: ABC transporter substrate-binding protein [Burkholderiales bacterium]
MRTWFVFRMTCALALGAVITLGAAQPRPGPALPRVGILLPGPAGNAGNFDAFYKGMSDLGYVEGRNVVFERSYGDFTEGRLRAQAAELVQRRVDVIVAPGPASTRAAREATSTIPIVMATHDAVELGLVASFGRPGGNVTGLSMLSSQLATKQLALLKETLPGISRVAILANPATPGVASIIRGLEIDGRSLGLRLHVIEVPGPDALADAFAAMKRERVEAFVVLPDTTVMDRMRDRIIALAAEQRLPSMFQWRQNVDAGGLMSYGPDLRALLRRTASYVQRILKGAQPGDLPVYLADDYELVLNLRTARAIGVGFPQALRIRAADKIE